MPIKLESECQIPDYERGPVLLKLNERLQAENFQACFTPFFTAVYNQEQLILQTTYVLKIGNSSKSAAVYNQERFQIKSGL